MKWSSSSSTLAATFHLSPTTAPIKSHLPTSSLRVGKTSCHPAYLREFVKIAEWQIKSLKNSNACTVRSFMGPQLLQ